MRPGANPVGNRHLTVFWLVSTLTIAAAIAVLTLRPTVPLPYAQIGADKIAHMLAFTILVLPTAALWPRVSAFVGLLAVAYGGAIELIQPFTGRHAEAADLVADGVGVALGIIIGSTIRRHRAARRTVRARLRAR